MARARLPSRKNNAAANNNKITLARVALFFTPLPNLLTATYPLLYLLTLGGGITNDAIKNISGSLFFPPGGKRTKREARVGSSVVDLSLSLSTLARLCDVRTIRQALHLTESIFYPL